jgi:hypothetical protein
MLLADFRRGLAGSLIAGDLIARQLRYLTAMFISEIPQSLLPA